MKEILNEEWLSKLLDTAIDSRIKQLELKFTAWDEYKELVNVKNNIQDLLEVQVPRNGADILLLYDDAYGLMVARASDYFYERGFADCLHLLGGAVEKKILE